MSIIDILTSKNNSAWICLKCAAKIRLSDKSSDYIILEMPALRKAHAWEICDLCIDDHKPSPLPQTPQLAIGIVTRDTK